MEGLKALASMNATRQLLRVASKGRKMSMAARRAATDSNTRAKLCVATALFECRAIAATDKTISVAPSVKKSTVNRRYKVWNCLPTHCTSRCSIGSTERTTVVLMEETRQGCVDDYSFFFFCATNPGSLFLQTCLLRDVPGFLWSGSSVSFEHFWRFIRPRRRPPTANGSYTRTFIKRKKTTRNGENMVVFHDKTSRFCSWIETMCLRQWTRRVPLYDGCCISFPPLILRGRSWCVSSSTDKPYFRMSSG